MSKDQGRADKADVKTPRWPEWAVRALCALARRILHEQNATCGENWPAQQDWHDLGHTSQHAFMRAAREECGVPHDVYKDAVQAVCDSGEYDLDVVWQDMDSRSEKNPLAVPSQLAPVAAPGTPSDAQRSYEWGQAMNWMDKLGVPPAATIWERIKPLVQSSTAAPDVVISSDALVAAHAIRSDLFGRRWGDAEIVAMELLRLLECEGGAIRKP